MTQLDKDVEQRFDEEFPGLANYDDKTDTWGNYKIKQFLAQEIQRAKEEGAREFAQSGKKKVEKIPDLYRMSPTPSYLVDKINEMIEEINHLTTSSLKGDL